MDMKEGKRDAFLSQSGAALKNRSLKERNRRNRAKIISKWKEFFCMKNIFFRKCIQFL